MATAIAATAIAVAAVAAAASGSRTEVKLVDRPALYIAEEQAAG